MGDWLGLAFIALLVIGAYAGLKTLSRPVNRSEEDFERNAAESPSLLGASMNALQELLNPEAAKAKEVQTQLKEGRFDKKKREGKSSGTDSEFEHEKSR